MRRLPGTLSDRRVFRYGLAFAGPAATAGAQFLLSLVLVRAVAPAAFGNFAFLLILNQFLLGVWAALFGAALPVILAERGEEDARDRLDAMFAMNQIGAVPVFALFAAIGIAIGLAPAPALWFALFSAVSMWRGFGRAYGYAVGRQMRVALSDIGYSVVVLGGLPFILAGGADALTRAAAILAVAAIVGLATFGPGYARRQATSVSARALSGYPAIWRMHSGWSLLGVLTTEATLNAHAYVVTLLAGPKAFAVLAASALLTRPVSVVLAALGEYERANMAREIARNELGRLAHSVRLFRLVMLLVWLATCATLFVILAFWARAIFPPHYTLATLAVGSALWMAVMLVRVLRAPESAMMQGAGAFRPLAYASIHSAVVSVIGVALLVMLVDPLWSIAGVLIGDLTFAASVWLAARRWWRDRRGGAEAMA